MALIKNTMLSNNFVKWLMVLSLFAKISAMFVMGVDRFPDSQYYTTTAQAIFNNGFVMPDVEIASPLLLYVYAFFSPLSEYFGNEAYAIADIIVSVATVFIAYKIALLVFDEDRLVANLSALVMAFYPYFVFYSISLLSETLYIFLLYLSFYFAIKFYKTKELKYVALFGIFFALDTLVRFVNLAMYPFFILLFLYFSFNAKSGNYYKLIFIAVISYSVTMSPWWIRNYQIYDEFIPTTVGAIGVPFYSGNNPMNQTGGGIGGVDVDLSQFSEITDPILRDEAMIQAGVDWIVDNPKDWMILEWKKLVRLYRITPFAPEYRTPLYIITSIFTYGIVLILWVVGLYLFRRKILILSPMLLFTALLTGVTLVFIGSIRYRLPIEPFMIIVASAAFIKSIGRLFKRLR